MNIVIDSNIFFSILVKSDGIIAGLFEQLHQSHDLYLCDVSFKELLKHEKKLRKSSKIEKQDFELIKKIILTQLTIIPSEFFTAKIITQAYDLVKETDLNDLHFIAAALFIDGYLWTGDKGLYNCLQDTILLKVYNSNDIKMLLQT